MKVPSQSRRALTVHAIAILYVAVVGIGAHPVHAGINVWTSHGPPGGNIRALVIDPGTPRTLYAGTWGAGVFKSTDGGATWDAANVGLPNLYGYIVSALAIDPIALYAATGTCSDVSCSGGVFKSTDGGATWSATGLNNDTYFVSIIDALAIDPNLPSTLYAGGIASGFFKSTDAGKTWSQANAGPPDANSARNVSALVIDPSTPRTLYAGTLYDLNGSGAVFKSTDAGETWSAASAGLPYPSVFALAIDPITDPSKSRTLYAGGAGGVFKSTNAGESWSAANAGLPTDTNVGALAIDPITPSTLYAGTGGFNGNARGIFKSTDAGNTWNALNTGLTNAHVEALAIDPLEANRVYVGTFGGGVFSIQQVALAKVVGTGTAASCTDAALNAALTGGGLVTFNCGGPVTIDISTGTGTKVITTDTTIDGGGLITISGGDSVGVFSVKSGANFTVEHVTIANGRADGGGGISNSGSGALTVTKSTFSNNRDKSNGGGGAISNIGGGPLTVSGSTFKDNMAALLGGAIAFRSGSGLTVSSSTFTGNTTVGGGSGIVAGDAGPITVTNSTFTGNTGSAGGRAGCCVLLLLGDGPVTVTNSTFTGNTGGAIFKLQDPPALLSNTILDAGSVAGDNCFSGGVYIDGGHNLDSGTSCGFSTANGSLSNTDPELDPAGLRDNGGQTETVALCVPLTTRNNSIGPAGCTAVSPAINAGDPDICAAAPVNNRDQRGFVRPGIGHGTCSMGAFEADVPAVACIGDCDASFDVTIDELVTGVGIALGSATVDQCQAFDCNGNGHVTVDCLVRAVQTALFGSCPCFGDGCR
jgi:hypothetical protein